jgi:hypothetical protein
MAEKTTQNGTIEPQPNPTPAAANVEAPAETGDRELSDADLDRVSGGAGGAVRGEVRRVLEKSPSF